MLANDPPITDLENLRQYVHQTLCDQNDFELGAFPITERILVRGDNPCGIFFCLHGPRSVKITAIWETERNSILFYGSTGERIHKAQLAQSPALEPVPA
jgi:hypothetical protein